MLADLGSWNFMLWCSIAGGAFTAALIVVTLLIWFRHHRELPKLPITRTIEALTEESERLQGEIAGQQDGLQVLEQKARDAQQTIDQKDDAEAWLQANKADIEQMQQHRAELDKLLADIEAKRADLDEAKAKLEQNAVELEGAKATLAATQQQADEAKALSAQLPGLQQEAQSLNHEVARLGSKVKDLGEAKEDLTKELDGLKAKLAEEAERKAMLAGECAAMESEIEHLGKLKAGYLEHLDSLKRDTGGIGPDHDPCKDLWQPWFVRAKTGGTSNEEERLAVVEKSLADAQIKLHPRTIRAFHTALKIQDISPLTVLAGVSGTGKSLLPNVYARTMGINCLQLPVQPGWSSPQDLFGFYNYIEQKYKATEFARALAQFDQFNEFPDVSRLDDQVLLVLLDEMNLARVEYYFSEMLSRLETRRDSDMSDPAQRQRVSVSLGVAYEHPEAGKREVALNMGRNVLFAGTMNEDESTLSLSDKVLDRASVMRFGKPTKFVHRKPDAKDIATSPMLSLNQWEDWCKGERSISNRYADMVDQLGVVMADAGCPFGHRVTLSMLDYVNKYPGDKDHAMADQIELKMLPKLRGRDLDRILNTTGKLKDMASELGDAALQNAIATGEQRLHGEDVFIWTGLDRAEQ